MKLPDGVYVNKVTIEMFQDDDCVVASEEGQTLVIELVDGGGGLFPVIKTDRWSVNPIEVSMLSEMILEVCEFFKGASDE